MEKRIRISTPSRIHLGFLELDNSSERIFGSIGLTISKFENIIEISKNKKFQIISNNPNTKRRIEEMIIVLKKNYQINECKIEILKTIPQHIGLGSGTQLTLAIGSLISEFNNLNLNPKNISSIFGRGLRSGIGIQSFKSGGFIVDCGKQRRSNSIPPVFFNSKWPREWKIILIFDNSKVGVSGKNETQEFKKIAMTHPKICKENCKALLMQILPGLMEKNFYFFTKGLQTIQENMSKVFYSNKKKYTSQKIEKIFKFLIKKKITGFGQTSWGPTGFIFCENKKKRNELFSELEHFIKLNNIQDVFLENIDGRNSGYKKKNLTE